MTRESSGIFSVPGRRIATQLPNLSHKSPWLAWRASRFETCLALSCCARTPARDSTGHSLYCCWQTQPCCMCRTKASLQPGSGRIRAAYHHSEPSGQDHACCGTSSLSSHPFIAALPCSICKVRIRTCRVRGANTTPRAPRACAKILTP